MRVIGVTLEKIDRSIFRKPPLGCSIDWANVSQQAEQAMNDRTATPDPSQDFAITDPATARYFSDFHALPYLRPFLARECTVADAATQLQVTRQRMNYWVNKMLRAKLIGPVRTQTHAGRPVLVYRTTHDSFVLHFSQLPHATIEGLMDFLVGQWWWERFKRAFTRAWEPGLKQGRLRTYREGGVGTIEPLPQTPKVDEAIDNHWRVMMLKSEQVAQFRQELVGLIDRYSELIDPNAAETIIVHVGVVQEALRR